MKRTYNPAVLTRLQRLSQQSLSAVLIAMALLSAASAQPASPPAAEAPRTASPSLPRSNEITFARIFEATLQHMPETLVSTALQQQAQSQTTLGRRWISGAPALEATVVDDGLMSDRGLQEWEAGVAVDLWRPGERRAAQAAGTAYHQRSAAWDNYLHWLTAGRIRDALADLERADLQLAAAHAAREQARRLLDTTRTLQAAGAVSRLEVLQAESQWLQHDRHILDAHATLADAEQRYTMLTGLSVRPDTTHQEATASMSSIPPQHPLLQLHDSELRISEAAVSEAERVARGSPSLSVGLRRERGGWGEPHIDSVGVSVSVPLASRSVVSAGTAQARTERSNAELARVLAMRDLTTQLQEARRALTAVDNGLHLAQREYEVNQQQWEMAQTAFSVGEIDLTDVILALQRAQASEYALAALRLRHHHLAAQYNQIIGVLP